MEPIDLFHGHVGAIDVVARALLRAAAIIEDGRLDAFRADRYAGWDGALGDELAGPGSSLARAADVALERNLIPRPRSGRQEMLENLLNRF
jgi:xylose isomerase